MSTTANHPAEQPQAVERHQRRRAQHEPDRAARVEVPEAEADPFINRINHLPIRWSR